MFSIKIIFFNENNIAYAYAFFNNKAHWLFSLSLFFFSLSSSCLISKHSMDLDRLKQNTYILLPACLALLSTLYLLKSSRSIEKKEGIKRIPYPRGSISWPIFGKSFFFLALNKRILTSFCS